MEHRFYYKPLESPSPLTWSPMPGPQMLPPSSTQRFTNTSLPTVHNASQTPIQTTQATPDELFRIAKPEREKPDREKRCRNETRPRARRLSYEQKVLLVRTCCQHKHMFALDHNTTVFWMTVVKSFKQQAALDTEYSWQTAQRRVGRMVEERQAQLQSRGSGNIAIQDRDLKDALDEWIERLDSLKGEKDHRMRVFQQKTGNAQWPDGSLSTEKAGNKRTWEDCSEDGTPAGRIQASKKRLNNTHSPHEADEDEMLSKTLSMIGDYFNNALAEEEADKHSKNRVPSIEQRVANIEGKLDILVNGMEEKMKRMEEKMKKLDKVDEILRHILAVQQGLRN